MICPFCLHKKSEIYNSRSTNGGRTVWRRRRCLNCGKVFTTTESFDPSTIWKVNKLNKISAYSRPKLALSIIRACDHRQAPEAATWHLLDAVEQRLTSVAAADQLILSPKTITETVATILKNFDAAAYVKYLSYHQPTMDTRMLRRHLRKT